MTKRSPAVAVLLPTYNGAKFLEETLHSIQNQSYPNLRVIIRDDGSSDASNEISRHFVADDPRFTLIEAGTRGGALSNVTALMGMAEEEFVKICCQDDPIGLRHVEKLIAPMLKHPGVTLSTSVRQVIDDSGAVVPGGSAFEPLVESDAVLEGRTVARRVLLHMCNQVGEPTTTLFRNGCFDHHAPFHYAGRSFDALADIALWQTLLEKGDLAYRVEPLSSFRMHEGQRSRQVDVTIRCGLEWAALLDGAVRVGLLAKSEVRRTAVAVLNNLQSLIHSIANAEDRSYDAFVPQLMDTSADTWRLVSGD
jgi:glycosyltransferase involved in cell wall biosynthesis